MPDEKKKVLPQQEDGYCFDETTCSPEFGSEGCKPPVNGEEPEAK